MERNLIQSVLDDAARAALPAGRAAACVINVASISGWSAQLAMSGPVWRGQGRLDLRHRTLGIGIRAVPG